MAPTKKTASSSSRSSGKKASTARSNTGATARRAAATTAKKATSTAKKASGTARKATGAAKRASGPARKATGTAASATKKASGAARKAAAPVTRAAGAVKRTAGGRSGGGAGDGRGQDAIQVLTADHREVEDLFSRFEKTGDRAHKRRQELVQRITEALSVHASVEEEVLYPAARDALPDEDDVLEALEEHHLVKLTLAELEMMDPGHERYAAKVTVLMENVRHHVEEEEDQLFPALRRHLDDAQRRELGAALIAAKRTAPTRPHPEAPDTPPGNLVAQVLTAPLDVAANLNKAAARRVRDIVS